MLRKLFISLILMTFPLFAFASNHYDCKGETPLLSPLHYHFLIVSESMNHRYHMVKPISSPAPSFDGTLNLHRHSATIYCQDSDVFFAVAKRSKDKKNYCEFDAETGEMAPDPFVSEMSDNGNLDCKVHHISTEGNQVFYQIEVKTK